MRALRLIGVVLPACVASLHGQISLQTNGGQAHLDQLPVSELAAIGGRVDEAFGHFRLGLSGSAANHTGLGTIGQFGGNAAYAFAFGGWQLFAGPRVQAARGIGEQWTRTWAGELREVRDLGWLRLQGGWSLGDAQIGLQHAGWASQDVSARVNLLGISVTTSWSGMSVHDSVVRDNVYFDPRDPRVDTLYRKRVRDVQDAALEFGWTSGRLSLAARTGQRLGAGVVASPWWDGTATLQATASMAFTMHTGRAPADVLLGLRGGEFTTFGLKLDVLQGATHAHTNGGAARELAVESARESPSTVRLVFILPPTVHGAAVTGDITGWHATDLTRRRDGRWEVVVAAKPGAYRIHIQLDDGPWLAPAGLPTVDDDFGGRVGLLVLDH